MKREITKETAEKIFSEYSPYIFRIVFFLTKSRILAEDITQDTFIQVFRKYYIYDDLKPIQPWLYKIALNNTRNTLKKLKRHKLVDEVPEMSEIKPVEEIVLKTEEEREIWREINNLTDKSKEVIVLHFYSGLKLYEIAKTLGIPLGTCKSRLNTALTSLRKKLVECDFKFIGEEMNII